MSSRLLLGAILCAAPVVCQGPLTGVSATFSGLHPARAKTFVRSSSDPDEGPFSPQLGNDDGFSGVNGVEAWRDRNSTRDLAVLADIQGRGGYMGLFFRNFWTGLIGAPVAPVEMNRTQILVDGVLRHDMPLTDYFRNVGASPGQIAPFVGPFTGNRAGGHLTHTPIVWNSRFKLQVFDNTYDNAARFHKVAGSLNSPEFQLRAPDLRAWETVYSRVGAWRHDVPRNPRVRSLRIARSGGTDQIVVNGPATILELRCRVERPVDWQHLRAVFSWDDHPAAMVDVPLRMLGGRMRPPFGVATDTLLYGNDGTTTIWSYYPMHFEQHGTLRFCNDGPDDIDLEVTTAVHQGSHPGEWGYFAAQWQQGVTQSGVTFVGPRIEHARGMLRAISLEDAIDTTGRIGPGVDLMHLEGDLCVRINDNRGDDHVFEASETSIGKWGWYGSPSDVPFSQDTSMNTGMHILVHPSGVTESDRIQGSTFVFDPIHFVDGIDIRLEHGILNMSNADYGLFTVFYLQPGSARRLIDRLDVGDAVDELAHGASFTTAPRFQLTETFFRDQFFGTAPLTDDGRELQAPYRFQVNSGLLRGNRGVCLAFRMDRSKIGNGGVAQAEIRIDGQSAGLLHSWTSNRHHRWKEGGELEVELPRKLTDGLTSFQVEVRPRPGQPVRIGEISVYAYTRD